MSFLYQLVPTPCFIHYTTSTIQSYLNTLLANKMEYKMSQLFLSQMSACVQESKMETICLFSIF